MTVRTKTFIIITVALALLMSAVFSITGRILLGEADRNDRSRAMQDVQRAGAALKYEIARLSVQTTDYAGWDESYTFIAGDNPLFVESNLSDETFSKNRFGFMSKGKHQFCLITTWDKTLRFNTMHGNNMPGFFG